MKRIIISGSDYCAVTEDGKLVEYLPLTKDDQCGDILLGRIDRIMPGMNCAFVNIGRKMNGFLPLEEAGNSFSGNKIRSGDMMALQIKKEEHGGKGAFLTRDITLPGKLVILMPMNRYIGVSTRIADEKTRDRLKETGKRIADGKYGLIMRYASSDATEGEIREETEEALIRWNEILSEAIKGGQAGKILMQGDPAVQLKKDYLPRGVEEIRKENVPDPELLRQLKLAGERILPLPSGGNIIIDRCEAMTVIDVNTASAAGLQNKEQTVLQTNMEACGLIARQVRLRNLSGIILIDFIDMETETDQSLVMETLEECFRQDRVKTVIHGWTHLGLMEMTRKRTRRERSE